MSRPTLVFIDGAAFAPEEARISVLDRGFLYGDGVFETLRVYRGVPFALDEHLDRWLSSAARVEITPPLPREALRRELLEAVRRSGLEEAFLRAMLTRGEGPLGLDVSTLETPARRVLLVGPVQPPPPEAYARGVAVVLYRGVRPTDGNVAEGAKVTNYVVAVLATTHARRAGAHEAVLVDSRERILEGASSSFFLVREGALITAPESAGVLAGITRAQVLSVARAAGIPCEERAPEPEDVAAADEAFLTSTIREVLPVVRVGDQVVGAGVPGIVTRRLASAYSAQVSKYMDEFVV